MIDGENKIFNIELIMANAKENLVGALEQLGPQLLKLGIVSVGAEPTAIAKSLAQTFSINLDGEINEISLIKLTFRDAQKQSVAEVNTYGWKDEGSNHLSGPATVDQFKQRILDQLSPTFPQLKAENEQQ